MKSLTYALPDDGPILYRTDEWHKLELIHLDLAVFLTIVADIECFHSPGATADHGEIRNLVCHISATTRVGHC